MRILITADLHYNIPRSRKPAEMLAQRVCETGGDVLVLAGDIAGADEAPLRECLRMFEAFSGQKFFVPGNHSLWCRPGENSMDRYERLLPKLAAEEGFCLLDHSPTVIGDVGLVGSIGWYDYSMREENLGIPLAFYEAKVTPGAADYLAEHRPLVEAHRDQLTESQLALGARWMDGVHVKLPMSDEEFVEYLCDKLSRQLEQLGEKVSRIVAVLHHLPTIQLVPADRPPRFAFAAAYMGSTRFGDILASCPAVTDVYCGHSHWPGRQRIGDMNIVNIGSTYLAKHLEVLEISEP